MAKIRKEGGRETPAISTASLPDIIFILLFFFMVVTVPRNNELKVKNVVPQATELTKIQKKSLVAHLYMGEPVDKLIPQLGTAPRLQLNDAFATVDQIPSFVENERTAREPADRPAMIWSLKVDQGTKMGLVGDVKTALRKVSALKISYATRPAEGAETFNEGEGGGGGGE